MNGKIIVLEGLSASGKKTQAEILCKKLAEAGKKVERLYFPSYDKTPFGALVARYLKGDYGRKEDIPETASLLFALDRFQYKAELEQKLSEGAVIVLDRYVQANMAFQGAFFDGMERKKFVEWIKEVESRLPQADLVLFLDMPRQVTEKFYDSRDQKNSLVKGLDIHEADAEYEERVRQAYLELADEEGWTVVVCADAENKPRNIGDIAEDVWKAVARIV